MNFLIPSSVAPPHPVPVKPRSMVERVADWAGSMGADWVKRNPKTVTELDASYAQRFGITRTAVNQQMLSRVPRNASVLEVGCSAGRQLDALAAIGFWKLEGIDLSADAVAECQWPAKVGDGRKLPYSDKSFDMVMTSGMYMHVPPDEKEDFLLEMQRVAKRWIYGCEMWTAEPMVWEFGDLLPPAWTLDWANVLDGASEWPVVERMMLDTSVGKPLQAFLLERP